MNSRTLGRLTTAAGGLIMAAGVALAIAVSGTAQATVQDGVINLNPDHVDTTADEFKEKECDGPLSDISEDQDGWHFVLPASAGDDFIELSLTFTKPDDSTVDVTITSVDENSPSTGPGWSGFIDNAGASGSDKHAYVITEAGWELTAGEAKVTNPSEDGFFNLSHTCPGVPESPSPSPSESESPSPSPSESESPSPSPSESESPAPPATTPPAAPPQEEKPELPVTGLGIGTLLVLGGGLLVGGIAMMSVQRRRDLVAMLQEG